LKYNIMIYCLCMKKVTLFLLPFLLVSLLAFSFKAEMAIAQTEAVASSNARLGLLPTSKFYFLKEWGRSIERFFTRKPIARAELELRTLEEKALEIRALADKELKDNSAYKKGLLGYQKTRVKLVEDLSEIPPEEAGARIDALIDKIKEHLLQESDVIRPLEIRFAEDEDFKEELEKINIDDLLFENGEGLDFEEDLEEPADELIDEEELEKDTGALEELEKDLDDLIKEDLETETVVEPATDCGPKPELAAPPGGCEYTIKCVDKKWDVKLICKEGFPGETP